MLLQLLKDLLLFGSVLIVGVSTITVIGAIFLGGLSGHKLTNPNSPNQLPKSTNTQAPNHNVPSNRKR